jgi:hypothetical protein
MNRIDEYDRELAHERTRRTERDDERKSGAPRLPARRRPRYSRFRALARIYDRITTDREHK